MRETGYLLSRDELVDRFRTLPSLTNFDNAYVKRILSLSKLRMYEPGETIIEEGLTDRWLYVVISGEVSVSKGGEELTRLSHVGDIFGEMNVIDGKPRSATITAVTNTTCLAIDASFLDALDEADKHPFNAVLYRLFSEILAERLRETDAELARCRRDLERLRRT
ncbi:putative transcriptional regulator, Crp/Fnr family [Alkalidesulfovibrio alkalitolerans DSM 16529]|jgi:CRP-like cAMP-binding protein|uniref:Putative transcriptional regulator, Crp/Fnr family n=1 Tax=Alkalidesulfovibrio alkalitolerans DSM 16529 TaxID=1121439 RepID=S7TG12_9BACT|nr:cyclic nucleotide-binding domain-containing protein [Alkalidesulfovibrio alkalitolerans]EPR36157.1 putative transcriptional regulator, Crp/Fnr family [Alkalidesulfovibrio alkalitolerans DSM 16529]